MDFISEKIENAEDIKYFNSFGFQENTEKELTPSWWVIDRTSSVFLFSCGRSTFGLPQKYGLCIDKELVELEALSTTEGDRLKSTLIVYWIISKIDIPVSLINQGYVEEDIIYIIEKAFTVFGLLGMDRKDIIDISVEIAVSSKIIKRESKKEEREDSLKKKVNNKEVDPFGCGGIAVIIFSLIISEIIFFKYDIEVEDSWTLGKLITGIVCLIYIIIIEIRRK